MRLFGQLIRTAVNTALVPVAVVADVVTAGGIMNGKNDEGSAADTYTAKALKRLKDEAAPG